MSRCSLVLAGLAVAAAFQATPASQPRVVARQSSTAPSELHVVMSAEDAARRAWLAKQEQPNPSIRRQTSNPAPAYGTPVAPAYSAPTAIATPAAAPAAPAAPVTSETAAKEAWLAKQEVPSWGHEVAALAEECSEGVEVACEQLSGEEEAKLAWLARQEVPTGAAPVAAAAPAPAAAAAYERGMAAAGFPVAEATTRDAGAEVSPGGSVRLTLTLTFHPHQHPHPHPHPPPHSHPNPHPPTHPKMRATCTLETITSSYSPPRSSSARHSTNCRCPTRAHRSCQRGRARARACP